MYLNPFQTQPAAPQLKDHMNMNTSLWGCLSRLGNDLQ